MYARSGDVNIAYQVIGNAPIDLVFVMGWVSHLEYFWREPRFARFLLRLASFAGSSFSTNAEPVSPIACQQDCLRSSNA